MFASVGVPICVFVFWEVTYVGVMVYENVGLLFA